MVFVSNGKMLIGKGLEGSTLRPNQSDSSECFRIESEQQRTRVTRVDDNAEILLGPSKARHNDIDLPDSVNYVRGRK